MITTSRAALLLAIALLPIGVTSSCAQVPATVQTPASPTNPMKLNYPDTTSGLERLAKEILKAQKEGDSARASAWAQTTVLPDPAAWYLQTFGPSIANDEGAKYAADRNHLPAEILTFFFGALQNHNTDVTAARFTETYPQIAREEHLQGTVRLHAIIDKDGSVGHLVVLQGYCSLAKSSMDAVSKWRYTPTLFSDQPVEVDTTIDVIFSLNH